MKFLPAEPNVNFQLLRVVSEGGRWECGLVPVLFGVRVRAALCGDYWCPVDYCAGDDVDFQLRLLATIIQILSALPETATPQEVVAMLPEYQVRPIHKDPCWPRLQEMAAKSAQSQEPVGHA